MGSSKIRFRGTAAAAAVQSPEAGNKQAADICCPLLQLFQKPPLTGGFFICLSLLQQLNRQIKRDVFGFDVVWDTDPFEAFA